MSIKNNNNHYFDGNTTRGKLLEKQWLLEKKSTFCFFIVQLRLLKLQVSI